MKMLGAIAGDIIGSVYERRPIKKYDFPLFDPHCHPTDDTVLTVALADSILTGKDYAITMKDYFSRYPNAGYGEKFTHWALSLSLRPYDSWGNGSAMRVSPIAWAFASLETVLEEAKKSAEVTHNHLEGVKGAQATAAAGFLARSGKCKQEIKEYVENSFGYDLGEPFDQLREHYDYDVSCQGTVPPAINAFLASKDYENAVRLAISLGGDSDTLACIAGGIAHAFYGSVPRHIKEPVLDMLEWRLKQVVVKFCAKFGCG